MADNLKGMLGNAWEFSKVGRKTYQDLRNTSETLENPLKSQENALKRVEIAF